MKPFCKLLAQMCLPLISYIATMPLITCHNTHNGALYSKKKKKKKERKLSVVKYHRRLNIVIVSVELTS